VIALRPIQSDRTAGVLEGTNAWERVAAQAFSSDSKVISTFSQDGIHALNAKRQAPHAMRN
jgi:hypothetical protein